MSPLQQSQGETQVAVHPGPNGHGASGVIEPLTAVPVENVSVGLMAVAGKAGWNAVFGNTQSTVGTGKNVINGL